jgi:hypothetical protein
MYVTKRKLGGLGSTDISCAPDPGGESSTWYCGFNDKSGNMWAVTPQDASDVLNAANSGAIVPGSGKKAATKPVAAAAPQKNFLSTMTPTTAAIAAGGVLLAVLLARS